MIKKIARAIAPFDFILAWTPYFAAGYILRFIIPPGQISIWQMAGLIFVLVFAIDLSKFIKEELRGDNSNSNT